MGEPTWVAYLCEGLVTTEPHVFDLIEAALKRRGLDQDTLYDHPEMLLTVLVEDVFEPVTTVETEGD